MTPLEQGEPTSTCTSAPQLLPVTHQLHGSEIDLNKNHLRIEVFDYCSVISINQIDVVQCYREHPYSYKNETQTSVLSYSSKYFDRLFKNGRYHLRNPT